MIVALLAVLYQAAQEIDIFPKDVVLFPFLALLAWGLFLYWIFAGTRANRIYRRVYNSWGKRRRLVTYLIVISVGAVLGGATAGAWWKVFELHRQRMQKLQIAEGQKEASRALAPSAAPTPTPSPMSEPPAMIPPSASPTPRPQKPRASKPREKRPTAAELEERRRIDRALNYNKPE
jgi:hypothetical protein